MLRLLHCHAQILPFEDPSVVLRLSGKLLLEAMENGVASFPKLDGRYLQVSGLRFVFDPAKKPGERVVSVFITNPATIKAVLAHRAQKPHADHAGGDTSATTVPALSRPLSAGSALPSEIELDVDYEYVVATRGYMAAGK